MPSVETVADMALVINYYEHLVQEWELWGTTVTNILGDNNGSVSD